MRERLERIRAWARQPVIVTRRLAISTSAALGLLAGGGLYAGATAIDHVAEESRERQEADQLTRADVAEIVGRLISLEDPGRNELLQRIRKGLSLCEEDRTCAQRLRDVADGFGNDPDPRPAPPDSSQPNPNPGARVPSPRPPGRPPPPPDGPGPIDPPGPRPPDPMIPRLPPVDTPDLPIIGRPPLCIGPLQINCPPE